MKRAGFFFFLLPVLLAGPSRADAFRTARISDVRGDLAVRGEYDSEASYVERNAVLREGDTLWTDGDGRAEIELGSASWLRLAEDTKIDLSGLPPSGDVRIWTGSLYADVSDRLRGEFRIKTPVGDVEIASSAVVRVDLDRNEAARVSVFAGRIRAFSERGRSIRLGPGERLYLTSGKEPDDPMRFDRSDLDGFDKYHKSRVDYYVRRANPEDFDDGMLGGYDLYDHGRWVVVESVRYWRPYYEPGWRPYSLGYWSYIPGCGYTWIDYAPWGYATSHYGRWAYYSGHGWLWRPGRVWGGAWVHWGSYGSYYGWCPLDPWDRPVYGYGGSGFSLAFGTGSFFIDFASWTFCDRDYFHHSRHHRGFGGGRHLFPGRDLSAKNFGFRLVGNATREFGVPQQSARGLAFSGSGKIARDQVLRVENRISPGRLKLVEQRFQVSGNRDREIAGRPGEVERVQRDRGIKLDGERILRGDDAERPAFRRGIPQEGKGVRPEPAPAPGERGIKPGVVPPERGKPGRPEAGERDNPFRRGEPGGVKREGRSEPGGLPGTAPSTEGRPAERPEPGPGVKPQPQPELGRNSDRAERGRDDGFRRDGGIKPAERPESRPADRPEPAPRTDRGGDSSRSGGEKRDSGSSGGGTSRSEGVKPGGKSKSFGAGSDELPGVGRGTAAGAAGDRVFQRGERYRDLGTPGRPDRSDDAFRTLPDDPGGIGSNPRFERGERSPGIGGPSRSSGGETPRYRDFSYGSAGAPPGVGSRTSTFERGSSSRESGSFRRDSGYRDFSSGAGSRYQGGSGSARRDSSYSSSSGASSYSGGLGSSSRGSITGGSSSSSRGASGSFGSSRGSYSSRGGYSSRSYDGGSSSRSSDRSSGSARSGGSSGGSGKLGK